MGILDKIKQTAKQAAQVASSATNKVAETAAAASQFAAKKIAEGTEAVTSYSNSAYDATCEFVVQKIKKMLRGIDLQSTIDALNKYHEEKGTDVSALVNFINQLKEFSEDGKE